MITAVSGSGWEYFMFTAIFLGIIVPAILFIIGLYLLRINKKRGKIILTIATVYAIISFGLCGGFGF